MDTFEAILTRRSIRQYKDQIVDEETQKKLLQAAMQAPSARNTQAWQFVIINDRQTLLDISNIHPYADMLKQAPLAIAVCGDFQLEENVDYLALNCAAVTENILLAAHSFGLGAVWLAIHPRKKRIKDLREILDLPDDIIPISLVAVGHKKDSKGLVDRFNPEKIHYNRW
jgi:nitroreductase